MTESIDAKVARLMEMAWRFRRMAEDDLTTAERIFITALRTEFAALASSTQPAQPSAVVPSQPEMPVQVPDPRVFGQVNLAERTIFVRHDATPPPVAKVEPTAQLARKVYFDTWYGGVRARTEIKVTTTQNCAATPPPVAGDARKSRGRAQASTHGVES